MSRGELFDDVVLLSWPEHAASVTTKSNKVVGLSKFI